MSARATAVVWALFLLLCAPLAAYCQIDTDGCLDCHDDAALVSEDGRLVGVLSRIYAAGSHGDLDCVDCHTEPGDYEDYPHYDTYTPVNCLECHDDIPNAFKGSVHADFVADGDMTCKSCHDIHLTEEQAGRFDPGCGNCHDDAAADYEKSVHRTGRRQNGEGAANCASCHGSHHVLEVADADSPVNRANIPNLCARCHANEGAMTVDFVRLPVAVPNYLASVHGKGWQEGKDTAVCTDCHGKHDSRIAQDPDSHINRFKVSETCSQCHAEIAAEYDASIHGRALALGIDDSPTCTDCHDEHLIKKHDDPSARDNPEHIAKQLCGDCHTDPELTAKYGIRGAVVDTYLDSYHGWAVDRGSKLVATCVDCHTVHNIRSPLDPTSSVNPDNVTATCARCHKGANKTFAQSYTHVSALEARAVHGWVRLIYLWLIAVVLGGMALHNFVIARYELSKHFRHRESEPYVVRWQRAERMQHLVLLLSFTGLAITGFALRFPDSWWVKLIGLGGHEAVRANLHRVLAGVMVAVALYHTVWVLITRHGRYSLREMAPRHWDVVQAFQNMAFYLGMRKERPAFRAFDYTQKAEYWAVVWGTWVMAFTGFVLWFPTWATGWAPAWIVRVSEVVHFYEAILAVSAIVIWHFFYVIFMPSEYPVSTIWLNGRMPASEWKEMHRGEYLERGDGAVEFPEPADSVARSHEEHAASTADSESVGQAKT